MRRGTLLYSGKYKTQNLVTYRYLFTHIPYTSSSLMFFISSVPHKKVFIYCDFLPYTLYAFTIWAENVNCSKTLLHLHNILPDVLDYTISRPAKVNSCKLVETGIEGPVEFSQAFDGSRVNMWMIPPLSFS